ncbi:MAG: hypothetical protein AAFO95_06420 [Cyanobacteria bacterium J06600_6]
MSQDFLSLPHVEAKTNIMVMNAVSTTVNNNVERVYDFISAEDVDRDFLQAQTTISDEQDGESQPDKPKMLGYEIEVGPWGQKGATRVTSLEGDISFRETVIDCQRPHYFQYMLTDFNGGWFEGLVDLGISTFYFSPHGPRTHINWMYEMRPACKDRLDDTEQFMSKFWHPWQQSLLAIVKEALDKDPWSA